MVPVSHQYSIFLLRGLAREIRHWGEFPLLLEKKNSECRSLPLEIPGAGLLGKEKAPLHPSGHAAIIRDAHFNKLSGERLNIALGLSFGAMIAAQWCNDYPKDFQGLILINTSCRSSPPFQRLRPQGALTLLKAMMNGNLEVRERRVADTICNLADTEAVARRWAAIAADAPPSRINAFRQVVAASRFSLPEPPSIPVLILTSAQDRLVSSDCSRYIARHWNASLISHPSAGHDLPTDDPTWCIETITSWLKKTFP